MITDFLKDDEPVAQELNSDASMQQAANTLRACLKRDDSRGVERLGLLMAVLVTSAALSDPAGAKRLFKRLRGACKKMRRIWVDGTYRGQLLEWVLLHCRFLLQPVLRAKGQKGFVVLPRRWVVKRTFAWLTQCRRLGKDYEVLTSSSEAMIYIAMTRLMLRRLAAS